MLPQFAGHVEVSRLAVAGPVEIKLHRHDQIGGRIDGIFVAVVAAGADDPGQLPVYGEGHIRHHHAVVSHAVSDAAVNSSAPVGVPAVLAADLAYCHIRPGEIFLIEDQPGLHGKRDR